MYWAVRRAVHRLTRGVITQQRALVMAPCRAVGGAVGPLVDGSVTVEQAVSLWAQHFQQHCVSEPLLSSQYIIAHVLGQKTLACIERSRLRDRLTEQQRASVWELCSKRLARMPVQYVIEEWDFRDITLKMRPPVFIPRPETEELVTLVLEDLQAELKDRTRPVLRCLEVGCGTGAISLSLLHSLPQLKAIALDKSQEAVCLAKENASRLGLEDRLEVHHLDIMKDEYLIVRDCGAFDVLVSNPPYLFTQDMESLQAEVVRFEDHAALDGGSDGLSVISQILALAPKLLTDKGRVYLEVDPRHPPLLKHLADQGMLGLQYLETHCDFTNRPRFCVLQRR
ncbi:MTRF1L release factor glutamine methyltransferase isoform X2 [Salminus brasiliensis]